MNKLPEFDPKEVAGLMASMDTDKSGKVDYTGNIQTIFQY